jgi:hypothetical protein
MVPASSDDVVLTDQQVRDYAEQGFLSLDRITSAAEVAVRPHQLLDPETADGLRLAEGDVVAGGVACPQPPGGATVHAGRTLDFTGANRTDEPRRALIMAFRATPVWEGARSFPWQPAARYE